MKPLITITEILGRAEQGMTRPFVCRGDDWLTYYVKGTYAVDGDESLPVQLDAEKVISALELPFTEPATFWTLP